MRSCSYDAIMRDTCHIGIKETAPVCWAQCCLHPGNMDITATLALNNGVHIPVLGLGTWLSEPGEVKVAVEFALKQGYKHVDCAAIYFNEKVPHSNIIWDVYVQVQKKP